MLIQLRIQGDVKLINLRNYVSIYYSYWLCGRIINVFPYLQKNETFFTLYCDQLNMIELMKPNSLNVCLHLKKLMEELKMEPFQQNRLIVLIRMNYIIIQ